MPAAVAVVIYPILILSIVGNVKVLLVNVWVPVNVETIAVSIVNVPDDVIVPPLRPFPVAIDVTVPELDGVTCVNVIESVPNVALVFVVHKWNVSAFIVPSWIITNCPASSVIVSNSVSLEAEPEATTV